MISFGANPAVSGSGFARASPWMSNKTARRKARNIIGMTESGRCGEGRGAEAKQGMAAPQPLLADTRFCPEGHLQAFESRGFAGCRSRIPCYTAASRLPALVRRSEHKERPMPDDKNKPAPGFVFGLTN